MRVSPGHPPASGDGTARSQGQRCSRWTSTGAYELSSQESPRGSQPRLRTRISWGSLEIYLGAWIALQTCSITVARGGSGDRDFESSLGDYASRSRLRIAGTTSWPLRLGFPGQFLVDNHWLNLPKVIRILGAGQKEEIK